MMRRIKVSGLANIKCFANSFANITAIEELKCFERVGIKQGGKPFY